MATDTPAQTPRPYIADPDLVTAAEVAMTLDKPLLLTGEPGTGKTSFARHLAQVLAPRHFGLARALPLYGFVTKSTSVATDLFYRFDSLRRFQATHDAAMSRDNRDYISFEALGLAILGTLPWSEVADLRPEPGMHPEVGRSVVLVDEIDKAPRDFPNDILVEIDEKRFRVPEVQTSDRKVREVVADARHAPLLVLTSNSEKNLPPAFLRRCVYHHIAFPDDEQLLKKRLREIIQAQLALDRGRLVDDAVDLFYRLRDDRQIDKKPATAELVDWVRWLRGYAESTRMDPAEAPLTRLDFDQLSGTLGVLVKGKEDLERARAVLRDLYRNGR